MNIGEKVRVAAVSGARSVFVGLLSGGAVAYVAKALKTALKVNTLSFMIATSALFLTDGFIAKLIHYKGDSDVVKLTCKAFQAFFAGLVAFQVYAIIAPYSQNVHLGLCGGLALLSLASFHKRKETPTELISKKPIVEKR